MPIKIANKGVYVIILIKKELFTRFFIKNKLFDKIKKVDIIKVIGVKRQ